LNGNLIFESNGGIISLNNYGNQLMQIELK